MVGVLINQLGQVMQSMLIANFQLSNNHIMFENEIQKQILIDLTDIFKDWVRN